MAAPAPAPTSSSTESQHPPGVAAGLADAGAEESISQNEPRAFAPSILGYIKALASASPSGTFDKHKQHTQTYNLSPAQIAELPSQTDKTAPALSALLSYFSHPISSATAPPPPSDLDSSKPLSWYFISSSHNTYLSGNQLYGEASGAAYESVLKRGCRCVEIDVWDGDEERIEREREREGREREKAEKQAKDGKESFKDRLAERLHRRSPSGHREIPRPSTSTSTSATGSGSGSAAHHLGPEKWTSASSMMRKEPRVLHGYTLTKEVSFREVCESIRDSAFETSDLPVIVSLEVHANTQQQGIMVEIMEECFTGMLIDSDTTACKVLPSPDALRNKILIKVKAAPLPASSATGGTTATTTEKQSATEAELAKLKLAEYSDTDSPSSSDEERRIRKMTTGSSSASSGKKKVKKSSIIPALSAMGKYTQAFHFKDLSTPEALIPTHVFSLSEKKLMDVHGKPGPSIFSHNKNFLMRAYPAGTRLASSNLDPAVFWRKGVQMVALNWQKFDAGTMMNQAQFAGSGGWLLKPEGYRGSLQGETRIGSESQVNAIPRKKVQLSVTLLAAQHLPMRKAQDKGGRLTPYVKCELHVERAEEITGKPIEKEGHAGEGEYKIESKHSKTADPDFHAELLHFPAVEIVQELSFIRFKIMDDVLGKDNLLAWSCIRLDRLREGYRLLNLLSADGVPSDAVMLVRIDKKVD